MLRPIISKGVARVTARALHYVVPNFSKIMAQEKPVPVYTSQEYQEMFEGKEGRQSWKEFKSTYNEFDYVNSGSGILRESGLFRKKQKKQSFYSWLETLKPTDKKIPGTQLSNCVRGKYLALIPFFMEGWEQEKHFVIRLELYPEGKTLKFVCLGVYGDYEILATIDSIIPITSQDYARTNSYLSTVQPYFLDLEMAYAHHGSQEVFLFNKFGKWVKEGVEHEALSLENTYDEFKWMEGFFPLNSAPE